MHTAKLIRNKKFWLINFGAGLLLAGHQAILTSQYPPPYLLSRA